MEPEVSMPHSQGLSNNPYPEPNQLSSTVWDLQVKPQLRNQTDKCSVQSVPQKYVVSARLSKHWEYRQQRIEFDVEYWIMEFIRKIKMKIVNRIDLVRFFARCSKLQEAGK